MSYDILIFEPDVVTDEDFPQWWEQVSRWEEPRDYDTTEGSTPAIRAFYRDLIRAFPPFNGSTRSINVAAAAAVAMHTWILQHAGPAPD